MDNGRKPSTPADEPRRERAICDPGNLMLLVYTLLIGLIILCGGLLPAGATVEPADASSDAGELSLERFRQGELLLTAGDGPRIPALNLSQDVRITVSGIAARVRVAQEFVNSGDDWVHGVYVFPLPEESAVDRLRMVIGEREIDGEIKEREEARAIYEQARTNGKKTSLLAQNRPNTFTTRVANIGPGEKVSVVIEYQQLVKIVEDTFSLRFPLAITPRYIPGRAIGAEQTRTVSFAGEGWARDTDRVPDASRITPPVAPSESGGGPTVTLSVDLVSGFPLSRLESLYHLMETQELGKDHHSLSFTGKVLADRDFMLEWQPEKGGQPAAALLSEQQGDNRYLLLMLLPPHARPEVHVPREAIFVLDISGSMAGPSIVQAKAALRQGLQRLQPADTFNVISFSSTADALFAEPRPADTGNVEAALGQLERLVADGGTEMGAALELALDGTNRHERLRQVIFLTDGAVGNEEELLALINRRLGDSRLFTVGIGSAPNSYFMTRAATLGRGTHTFIGDVGEVRSRMERLLTMLEAPVLTDIAIRGADGAALALESYPRPIPDLYFGEPLMVAVRTTAAESDLVISGRQFDQPWEYRIDVAGKSDRPGIGALWARKKIRSMMEALSLGADEAEVKKAVLATALEHRLVSRYTSLVAVDKTVSRPKGTPAAKEAVEGAAPRGLQLEAVFGGGARTATPAALQMLSGSLVVLAAGLLEFLRRRLWRK